MFLDSLFRTNTQEARTQLHFRDDGCFQFRVLPIEDTFLVEKVKDEITRGWKHFYRNQFPFAGYRNIRPGQVTLSYDRDIILDPYGLIEGDQDNPVKASDKVVRDAANHQTTITGVRSWLSEVGEARRLKMMANRAKSSNYNRIIMFLGSALVLEMLIIGISVLQKGA